MCRILDGSFAMKRGSCWRGRTSRRRPPSSSWKTCNESSLPRIKASRSGILREAVWRTYKTVMLLAKDNSIRSIDLGLVHSSADASLVGFIVNRLKQDGDISEGISPKFLVRNWSGAHKEWSTKAVKDAVFASPLFPRLLNGDLIRDTIARGVSNSVLAYVGQDRRRQLRPVRVRRQHELRRKWRSPTTFM